MSNKKNEIIGIVLILLSGFIFLSLIATTKLPNHIGYGSISGCSESYSFTISSPSDNLMGGVGDLFYNVFRCSGFGLSSVLFPIILSFWGLFLFKNSDEYKQALKLTAYAFVLMVLTAMTGAWISDNNTNYSGKFGWSLFIYFKTILGFGIYLFLPISYLLIVSIYYQISIYTLFLSIFKAFKMVVKFIYIFIKESIQRKTAHIVDKASSPNSTIPINGSGQNESPNSEMWADELDNLNEINNVENTEKMEHVESYDIIKSSKNIDSSDETNSSEAPIIEISEEAKIDSVDLDGLSNRKSKLFNYKLPSVDFLNKEPEIQSDISDEVLRAKGQEIIDALATFGVSSELVGFEKGPVITMYKIEPAEGVRVNKFTNLADDLARVMKASRIRVLAPIPGSNSVGIELPNENPKIVYFKNIVNSKKYADSESKLTIGLGKTTKGDAFCFDLQKMPHLLVAGATGAGKSVCINTIIVSILYKAKPDEVKFILVDPKKLELATYKSLVGYHLITAPDLDEYVMTTAENAVGILDSAITEMERRFQVFADARVRNIGEYHEKQKNNSELEKIPYIVVLIDELADLMMTSGRAIEDPITRLAQKARAVGIHLVVATQRPSVDVITGLIKSNFPARISFQVAQKIDSRTILDQMGAEKLLGRGDLLFLEPGKGSPTRLHNAFITLDEIEKIMQHISSQSKPEELMLPESKKEKFNSEVNAPEKDRDEYLIEAAKIVVQNQQASVSLLQRKLKIGYSRAGRLVDELEALGIISGYSGSKARSVLVDESYIDKIFN
mgnify:CR=1 FL=1